MGVTALTKNQHIGKEPAWHVWEFTPDTTDTQTDQKYVLRACPKGTVALESFSQCIRADVGAGAVKIDIEAIKDPNGTPSTVDLMTGTADNMGATGTDYGTLLPVPLDVDGDIEITLQVNWTQASGTSTTSPVARVYALLFRPEFPI